MASPLPRWSVAASLRPAIRGKDRSAANPAARATADRARLRRTSGAIAGLSSCRWRSRARYGIGQGEMERDKPPKNASTTGKRKPARLYQRPRGGGARSIGDLMPQIGRTAFRRFGFVQSSVVTRWPEIVGPQHSRVCIPEAIRFPPGEKSEGILQLVVQPA